MVGYVKKWPKIFEKVVIEYGNPDAKTPVGWGNGQQANKYQNAWNNPWLVKRLYNQWRHAHAIATGKQPPKNWFYFDYDMLDWRQTVMRVMNAEYYGNASFEWFELREDENGEKQMRKTNWFRRIENVSDPRLDNPALEYLFTHIDLTIADAFRELKASLEKK